MSFVDLNSLSKKEMILHYVMACSNKGLNLSYNDLMVIESWIKEINSDYDSLMLILSEILPKYYENKERKVPLKKIQSSVLKKIREFKNMM